MYKQELYTVTEQNIANGIKPFNNNNGFSNDYKHGYVFDKLLDTCHQKLRVPSKWLRETCNFYGLFTIRPWEGSITLTYDKRIYPYKESIDTKYTQMRYKANSREVLKPINTLTKSIKANQKLLGEQERQHGYENLNNARRHTMHTLRILLLYANTNEQLANIKNYQEYSVLDMINSPRFKHFYKVTHPDTTFYTEEGSIVEIK